MKTLIAIAAATLIAPVAAMGAPAPTEAPADPLAEALGQCMAMKTTGEDRLLAARWTLVNLSIAPQANGFVTAAPGKKEGVDRGMAKLFTRLFTVDCAAQAHAMFAAHDQTGFRIAGEVFGRVAMQELMTDPQANAAMSEFTKYLNEDDFKGVTGK